MGELLNNLFKLGLTISLADREAFVEKMSKKIEEYQADPEKADHYARIILSHLEELRDNMNMKSVVKDAVRSSDVATKEDISELSKAIKEFTEEIKELKRKDNDV